MLTVGSLFAGIGGIELGLESTGEFKVVWQVENDPFAIRVLEKHWPNTYRHEDVLDFPPQGHWYVDLICAGWPCQDISKAGTKKGLEGERSGLFYEVIRIAEAIKPRILLLENVSAILARGRFGIVLGELASIGYDVEWHCLPAGEFNGNLHRRDRIFLICTVSDASRSRGSIGIPTPAARQKGNATITQYCSDRRAWGARESSWSADPGVRRVANGIPDRVHRLHGLGNAVCPQVAKYIGELILERIKAGISRRFPVQCYLCRAELIWGGDHDYELSDLYSITTNLTCENCGAHVVVYHPPHQEDCNGSHVEK